MLTAFAMSFARLSNTTISVMSAKKLTNDPANQ